MKKSGTPLSRRRFVQGSAAVGAAAAVTRPGATRAASDTLRVRSYADLQVLDPAFILSAPETDIDECLFHKLITGKTGDSWGWELDAADSIEAVDDLHVKFTLKSGIGWTNGFGELTANDVKYTYERVADPAVASPYAEDWSKLDHVEVHDDRSGTIVLKEPYAPLWTTTLPALSGFILSEKAMKSLADGKYTTTPPATSGPYVIKEWTPKQRLVLALNPDYTGTRPDFGEVVVVPIEDELAAETAFMAGELDYTTIAPSSLPALREKTPDGAKLIEKPSLKYVWVGINGENPQFTDQRVRRAVQLAIDIDAIMEAAYFGVAKPATGIIPPGLIGHREKTLYSGRRDIAQAKALLVEAGLADGFKCRIDLLNKQTYLSAVQVIQANLAEIGVEAEINAHDSGVWWTMGDESSGEQWKDLQIMYNRFSSNPDPAWYTVWFTTAQVGIWNWERFSNAEFDDLHAKALVELDPAKRDVAYQRMQDIMEESGQYTFVTHELTASIHADTIVPALQPDGTMIWKAFKKA